MECITYRLRVHFIKAGRLALLSHLEIARALERCVRRAGLPYAISQGFSPHMRIGFGAALPVGVGSVCEIFDVFLTEQVDPDWALEQLKLKSAPDLMVQSCYYIDKSKPAASVAFPLACYEARFTHALSSLDFPHSISVIRKKKEKELVLKDFIHGDLELTEDGRCLRFWLEAKATGSLRPDLFIEEILKLNPDCELQTITRIEQRELDAHEDKPRTERS